MLIARTPRSRPARAWIDRLTPAAASLVVVGLAFGIAAAVETGTPTALAAVLPVAFAALAVLVAARRRAPSERPWGGIRPDRSSARPSRPEPEPSDRAGERRDGAGPPATWRVVAALGRFEARELACSPWLAVGIGFQLWMFATFAVLYSAEDNDLWAPVIQQLVAFCHPLVGMAVIGAHAATTRGRHDGAEELYSSLPTGATTRTLGLLSTAAVPAAALAAFLAAYLGVLGVLNDRVSGPAGADAVPDLLAGVVLGVGGVALGVAVGRWVRFRLAPVVAVVAVGAVSLRMGADGGGWTPWAQLSTFLTVTPEVFRHRAAWWYLAWLLGLTAVVGAVALARPQADEGRERDRARSAALVVGALGVAVAVVAGVMVTRPLPGPAAALLADRVGRPAAHQACVPAADAALVCAYRGYEEMRDRVAAEVAPVAAALPAGAGPVTLRHVYTGSLDDLPPEVARRLADGIRLGPSGPSERVVPGPSGPSERVVPGPSGPSERVVPGPSGPSERVVPGPSGPSERVVLGPGDVGMPLDGIADGVAATRFLVPLHALGLPVEPGRSGSAPRPAVVAGQARGVVALWLAAQGLSPGAAATLATARRRGQRGPTPASADAFDRGFAWPTSCDSAPIVWSAQDLAAARALIAQPVTAVTAVVHAGWDRWRDPATGTDELLAAAGLPAVGPFDPVATRDPGTC